MVRISLVTLATITILLSTWAKIMKLSWPNKASIGLPTKPSPAARSENALRVKVY